MNHVYKRPGPPSGATRTIFIQIQYEGSKYVGWQRQAKGTSIQGLLELSLQRVACEKITLFSASRTDAGVHAIAQTASFSLKNSKTPVRAFVEGTNALLPDDIRVVDAKEVDLWFHSNQDAKEKTYRYYFRIGRQPMVFLRKYAWQVFRPLDLNLMKNASQYLIGKHDFSAFRTRGQLTKTSIREIRKINWGEDFFGLYYFEITATGFLKHMVRNIFGTLVEVGLKKKTPEEIQKILESKQRKMAGQTAPPHGLFLWHVLY